MYKITENLKTIRQIKGLSKAAVARAADIPYSTYDGYEKGYREPRLEQLKRIAEALDITLAELISPPPPTDDEIWENAVNILEDADFTVTPRINGFLVTNDNAGTSSFVSEDELLRRVAEVLSAADKRRKNYIETRLVAEFDDDFHEDDYYEED